MGKTTDDLIHLANSVSATQPPREYDMLVSTGERISMSAAGHGAGRPRASTPRRSPGARSASSPTTTTPGPRSWRSRATACARRWPPGKVPVVAGFQGVSTEREITTLGRGGSDATAVALAAVLDADVCEIYTDVTGVFTADPRIVPEAHRINRISFDEMLEMAATGRPRPDAARRRVRPQPQRPAARAQQLHLGAGHLGGRGGCRHGRSRRHRGDPRHLGGQGHRQRGARTAPASRPGSSGPWPTSRSTST